MLVEGGLVPAAHSFQAIVLLHERVDRLDAETVVNNLDEVGAGITTSREDNGGDLGAVLFELLGLLDCVREVGQNELVSALESRVDDLLEHLHNQMI